MVRLQPTPTDRIDNKNLSTLDKMIFCYLWCMTRGEVGRIQFYNGNKKVDFEIERGQVFVQIAKMSLEININRKNVTKSIENIKKWYINMDITRKSSGLLITWVSYDEIIKMDIKKDITGTSQGHHRDKQKQDSIKIDKIDKETLPLFVQKYIAYKADRYHQVKKQVEKNTAVFRKKTIDAYAKLSKEYTDDQIKAMLTVAIEDNFRKDNIMTLHKLLEKKDGVAYSDKMLDVFNSKK